MSDLLGLFMTMLSSHCHQSFSFLMRYVKLAPPKLPHTTRSNSFKRRLPRPILLMCWQLYLQWHKPKTEYEKLESKLEWQLILWISRQASEAATGDLSPISNCRTYCWSNILKFPKIWSNRIPTSKTGYLSSTKKIDLSTAEQHWHNSCYFQRNSFFVFHLLTWP